MFQHCRYVLLWALLLGNVVQNSCVVFVFASNQEQHQQTIIKDDGESDSENNDQGYTILQTLPHDKDAFTQGLTFDGNTLYESTGRYRHSQVRILNIQNGSVHKNVRLPDQYFGEGLAFFETASGQKRLIQLVWKRGVGFVYDAKTLKRLKIFRFQTERREGWGITYNPQEEEFIVSDGSSSLYFWDRDTLEEKRRVNVSKVTFSRGKSLSMHMTTFERLNELEYIQSDGSILANVWKTDQMLRIDPRNGSVKRVYDFSGLHRPEEANVFNGISITEKDDEIWVTGKFWPNMYRVRLE